ncbi:MAG TPA: hypothetical protein VIN10_11940 [Bacteroidales bacterium]
MSFKQKLKKELISIGLTTLYFLIWFTVLVFIKELLLKEYKIEFNGMSKVFIGALVAAKVLLILENVPFGYWVKKQPAIVDVFLRTVLYFLGVLLILILEKAFDGRHEFGGFINSLQQVFVQFDMNHFWVNSICIFGALFGFNFATLLKLYLGDGGILRILASPPPSKTGTTKTTKK